MANLEGRLSKLEQRAGVDVPHKCIEKIAHVVIDPVTKTEVGETLLVIPCKVCGREGRDFGYTAYAEPRPWRPEHENGQGAETK